MPSSTKQSRLIIAPVGGQLLGVWSPLLALDLQRADCVVFLLTQEIRRQKRHEPLLTLVKERFGAVCVVEDLGAFSWERLIGALPKNFEPNEAPVYAMCNGCLASALPRFVEDSIAFAELSQGELFFVVSRDEQVLFLDRSANVAKTVGVAIASDDALSLLGLRYDTGKKALVKIGSSSEALANVSGTAVRGAQLIAFFDLTKITNEEARVFYKNKISNWSTMLHFGLDSRAIVCRVNDAHLQKRMAQDKVDYYGTKRKRTRRPQQKKISRSAPLANRHDIVPAECAWDNDEAVALSLGPQASTTIQALWGHRAGRVVLVADDDLFSGAVDLAHYVPCRKTTIIRFARGENNATLSDLLAEEPCKVNTTPGDRLLQTTLTLLALKHGQERWLLDKDAVVPVNGGSKRKKCDRVPPGLILRRHALNARMDIECQYNSSSPAPGEISQISDFLLRHFQGKRPCIQNLHNLVQRHGKSPGTGGVFLSGDRWVFDAGGIQVNIPEDYDIFFEPVSKQREKRRDNGRWLELVAGVELAKFVDQVHIGVRYHEGTESGDPLRDELDVIAERGGRLVLFSCKTSQGAADDFATARAQADRFLGREATVVLLVPRLVSRSLKRGEFEFKGCAAHVKGLCLEASGRGFLGDLRCITDSGVEMLFRERRGRV